MAKKYDESSIKVLKGLDAVRAKPSMYIGLIDSTGLFTILREVMDNTVDEFYGGRNIECLVTLDKDGTCTVSDKGEGVPIGKHKTEKVPTIQVIFSQLHAGGKLEKSDAYKNSVGTHGVGAKAANALSTSFEVWTKRDGKWWYIAWSKGKLVTELEQTKQPKDHPYKQGTMVRFKPDLSIFDKGSQLNVEEVQEWAETTAYLSDGYKITIVDNTQKKPETLVYHFANGIQDWITDTAADLECTTMLDEPLHFKSAHCDFILNFSDADGNNLYGYTNGLWQPDGGNHLNTTLSILFNELKGYATAKQSFTRDDLSDGLLGIINFKIDSPRFSSQTKEKLTDTRFEELCKPDLEELISKFFKKNKALAKQLCERASSLRGAKEQFTMQKKTMQELKKRQKESSKMPTKLAQVKCKPDEREVFIVEGDSAAGTAKSSRMANPYRYQEILGIRGKISNALKTRRDTLLNSEEVLNILTAIGYDPSVEDPMSKLRTGKIILLADADEDGKHINSLLLCLFNTLLPQLFTRGLIYAVDGPKYVLNDNGKQYFANTMEELKEQLPKGVNPDRASYLKGWGEATATALREIAFNPETRRLRRITAPTKKQMEEFQLLMGDNADYRKQLLGVS